MADEQTTTDSSGIARTATGEIAPATTQETSSQTTTQETGSTLLTQEGKTKPAATETKEEGEKKEPAKAPESYAEFKVPEGYKIEGELKTEIDTLFKKHSLPQEAAQELIDFYVKQTQSAFQEPFDAYQKMTDGWREEAMNHPDLKGKLGPGMEVNVRIGKALAGLPDQKLASDFRALMDLTGAGNHPAFIRVIDHFAKMVTEGTHVAGNGPSTHGQSAGGTTAKPTAAQAMYPTLPSSGR